MRRTLQQLITDEHFAVIELEASGKMVEFHAAEVSKRDPSDPLFDFAREEHEKSMEKRDEAMEKLEAVRKELKQYLVDIINNY